METKEFYEKYWLTKEFINDLPLAERKAVIIGAGDKVVLGQGEIKDERIKIPVEFVKARQKEWTVSFGCYEVLAKEFGTESKDWVGGILLFSVDRNIIRVTVLGKDGKEILPTASEVLENVA